MTKGSPADDGGLTLELPPGPCATFLAPGGLSLAIYERSRPFVLDSFAGRHDF